MRTIDADALIKKFQSDKEYFDKVGDTTFAMATIGVINDIDKAPTIDAVSEWIPCSERLPEKQTTVLYSLEGCVSVAFMTDRNYTGETVERHWEDLETGITIYPEAWMPLPKPWKGADDE